MDSSSWPPISHPSTLAEQVSDAYSSSDSDEECSSTGQLAYMSLCVVCSYVRACVCSLLYFRGCYTRLAIDFPIFNMGVALVLATMHLAPRANKHCVRG